MNKKLVYTGLLCLSLGGMLSAQIQEETLILQGRKIVEVKKVEKKTPPPAPLPDFPPKEKADTPMNYDITDIPAVSDFRTSQITQEDVSPKFVRSFRNNYLRVAGGNYGALLADGNVTFSVNKSTEIGADVHFYNTVGSDKVSLYDNFENKGQVHLFGNHYGEKAKLLTEIGYDRHQYNFYGVSAPQVSHDADLEQTVGTFHVNALYDLYSDKILDKIKIETYFLSDDFKTSDRSFFGRADLVQRNIGTGWKEIRFDIGANVGVQASATKYKAGDMFDVNMTDLYAVPYVKLYRTGSRSYVKIGSQFHQLNRNFYQQIGSESVPGVDNRFRWIPEAEVSLAVSPEATFRFGVDGGVQLNTYRQMLDINPYLYPDQHNQFSTTRYHAYAGLEGDLSRKLNYKISAGIADVDHLQYYSGVSLPILPAAIDQLPKYALANTFRASYLDATVVNADISLNYFPLDRLSLGSNIHLRNYQSHLEGVDVRNLPKWFGDITAKYTMLDQKIHLGLTGFFAGGREFHRRSYDLLPGTTPESMYHLVIKDETLPAYFDLNLSAEYQVYKNFSIFALGNNLLNTHYEVQQGYRKLGAQFLLGLKVAF